MVSAHEELAGKILRISMLWHYRFNTLVCEYVMKFVTHSFPTTSARICRVNVRDGWRVTFVVRNCSCFCQTCVESSNLIF